MENKLSKTEQPCTIHSVVGSASIRKAQVIVCKCGAKFAACVEPHCYTEKDWQKDLRKYVNEGCTVEMVDCASFRFEKCRCKEIKAANINEPTLF